MRSATVVCSAGCSCGGPGKHAGVGVDDLALVAGEAVLDEEGALSDLPERPAAAQLRQQLGFGVGEPEQLAGPGGLGGAQMSSCTS